MALTYDRTVIADWKKKIASLRTNTPTAVGRALYQESQVEATESKKRTPVDTGALRATIGVVGPFTEGKTTYTLIVAGGPAAPYAIYVHEDPYAFHKVGGYKFIESTLMESVSFMAARVAARMDLNDLIR